MNTPARRAIRILSGNGPIEGDVVIQTALGELVTARVQGQHSLGAFQNAQAALQAIQANDALVGQKVWQSDGQKTVEVT